MSAIKKIKEELSKMFSTLSEEDLARGKIYTADELKVSEMTIGGKVELVNDDGSLAPAPDGDYEMEDGTKFTVKDGFIIELNGEKEAPVTDEPAQALADSPVQDAPVQVDLQAEIDSLKTTVDELKKQIDEMKAMFEEQAKIEASKQDETDKFSKQLEELNETIKTLAKIPAEFSKTNNSVIVKDSKEEKMNDLLRVMAGRNK